MWLAKQTCPGQRLLLQVPHPKVTLVTDLEMAPAVKMKRVGPWIHVSLSEAMTLGPRSLLLATSDSWRLWAILSKVMCMSQVKKLFRIQPTTRMSCLRSSLQLGSGCRHSRC
jgi:hypothetical protein